MNQNHIPVIVGDGEAQKRFITTHEAFLREFPEIQALFGKMIHLTLARYNEKRDSEKAGSEQQDQKCTDLRLAQIIVFYLWRTAFDDYGDLLILAGNGRGIGAKKLLRGMYEHLVTAAFIAQNPAEAKAFNDHAAVEKGKIWNRLVEIDPSIRDESTPEEIQGIEDRFRKAQAQVKSELCNKCGQPVTQEAWTRASVDTMAAKVDAISGTDLAKLYASYYLMPTYHAHPTAYGLESRLQTTDDGLAFKELSEHEATDTVMRAHILILRLFKLFNGYFQLGLDGEVGVRRDSFAEIWGFQE